MSAATPDGYPALAPELVEGIRIACGASAVEPGEILQPLWSGFGRVQRVALHDAPMSSAILKLVDAAAGGAHPHGWNTDRSTQRKRTSYQVERQWYARYAERCNPTCRVPMPFGALVQGHLQALVLEDLDSAFPRRRDALDLEECLPCLSWLARFHVQFLADVGNGLWPQGSYWHLATRPDEFAAMPDSPLRRAAPALDDALRNIRFRTLVHGDAKLANFCFSPSMDEAAALDFQYVGGGCGMRDVVYFLGSALPGAQCRRHEQCLLDAYFGAVRDALARVGKAHLCEALEAEWRALYAIAWADFLRFLLGWEPAHRKVSPYARELAARALAQLADERD